jgi:tRNA(fMet)-specific endonuclease VapC
MTFLLDTNAVIGLLEGRPPAVRERFRQRSAEGADFALSSIVLYELWFGVARSGRPEQNAQRLRVLLSGGMSIEPFDEQDAAEAGRVRAELARGGRPIGPYDVLIAGQALRLGATVVTANVGEFARVPGLSWEDWAEPG